VQMNELLTVLTYELTPQAVQSMHFLLSGSCVLWSVANDRETKISEGAFANPSQPVATSVG
jgi:hypothetical protein